jgi:hypothetical protein
MFPQDFRDRQSGLRFLQDGHDLGFTEFRLPHFPLRGDEKV